MTWYQIVALVILGPVGLWALSNIFDFYVKKFGGYTFVDVLLVVVSATLITLSFIGFQ